MYLYCLICGWKRPLQIEHNHKTGIVRGYVCSSCNLRISYIESGKHRHFRYVWRFLWHNNRPGRWFALSKYYFGPCGKSRLPIIESLNDIEVIALPCRLFHEYLESPPLAGLNLKYQRGMCVAN